MSLTMWKNIAEQPLSLLLLSQLFTPAFSDTENNNNAAGVFTYSTDTGSDFTFALNAVRNGDLYFHMSGPSKYSWLAVGIGEDMEDNLMFILHEADNKGAVTVSPRVAMDGNSEPTYYPAIQCEQLEGGSSGRKADGSRDVSTMSVDAVCHNATSWDGGSLDLSSSSQEWMFAFGPDDKLHSTSMSAPLIRHETYGNFQMDMTQATTGGSGTVPSTNGAGGKYVSANTSAADGTTSDGDYASIVHGVVMCVAYILLYPLGALLLRLAKRMPVRLHWICQSIASLLVLVGFGLAVVASGEYNRSRNYDDPHQIIGIILLAAAIVQLGLGGVHHFFFKKRNTRLPALRTIHLVIGPCIILLAMVNGGLGLNLACKWDHL